MMAAVALVLAAAIIITIASGMLAGHGSWPFRLGVLGGGLAIAGGLVILCVYRKSQNFKAVERCFEALCKVNPRDLHGDGTTGDVPPLPACGPWSGAVEQVRDTILELCRQVQDLEHASTAAQIRSRRVAAESDQIKWIFSELADPILAVDNYDELLLANHTAEDLFQIDANGAESRLLSELVQCQKLVDLLTSTSRRKTCGNRTDEIEITDEQGQSHWYRVTATKLLGSDETDNQEHDDQGDSSDAAAAGASGSGGAVAVLRDIGDQKALQKRNAEFVSAVSHEMKTPLAGIKAYVEMLVDGDAEDEETQEEFLNVINSQADRLQRLIDNMLNLARIEAGVVNVSKQPQSLNELLEEALHVVQPAAEAKQIELLGDLSPMYLGVLADRDMLLQAAINLLSNAIKYTAGGGRVALRSRMVDNQARFEVQDTGVGLSEEDAQRVFEKFYRVKKDKTMASGTGLGLPLAKHIVEDVHGGQLTVESALGEGSAFAAIIPSAGQLDA